LSRYTYVDWSELANSEPGPSTPRPYTQPSFTSHAAPQWTSKTRALTLNAVSNHANLQQRSAFHSSSAQRKIAPRLTHLNSDGEAHMVNVTEKSITSRRAIAVGRVVFSSSQTSTLIKDALIKKGDVLGTARLAGIMAAKNCPSLIPLCHPILISGVRVDVKLEPVGLGSVTVESEVKCVGQTGVEMEALTSVTGALLTVIDMVKGVDRGARIEDVRLVLKEGGRSGLWRDESWYSRPST
jgi:molybdenum cofactor biosynthesis protein MoaC